MGPFELMDLVGIDVGFEVSKSFYAQSFGEPRWRPSMLAARKVGVGRPRPQDRARLVRVPRGRRAPPARPRPAGAAGGDGARRDRAAGPRWPTSCATPPRRRAGGSPTRRRDGEVPALVVDCGGHERGATPPLQGGPQVDPVRRGAARRARPGGQRRRLLRRRPARRARRAHAQPDAPRTRPRARRRRSSPRSAATSSGSATRPASCSAGSSRQLVNEACFALGEGVGSPEDIDAGMVLGLNHPRGPLEWGDAIGPASVLGVLAGPLRGVPRGALPPRARAAARGPHAGPPLRS